MKDAIRVLLCVPLRPTEFPLDEAQALAWLTPPPTAHWSPTLTDIDLGDEECKGIPTQPIGVGLWIVRWEYSMGPGEYAEDVDTAHYANECTWTRPTLQDLIAFGVLP